jgi:hypothetical protein
MSEAFTTCACQNCGKLIEFDRSQLPEGEARTVECPHCHFETIIFARKLQPLPVEEAPPAPQTPQEEEPTATTTVKVYRQGDVLPPTPQEKKPTANLLRIGSIIMFLVGLALVIGGCGGDVEESARETGSAIRQTVYAVQYGAGFVLMMLSMILAALTRLIAGD